MIFSSFAPKSCLDSALFLLTRREHSRRELTQKLLKKKFSIDEINAVISDLQRRGLQSDQRFAESYANMRIRRGYGPVYLRAELLERGVAAEIISELFSNYSRSMWEELAVAVRQKKFGAGIPEKYSREQQKQERFLCYRGFTQGQIKIALKG